MHPAVERLLGLRIDISLTDQAAEGGLDVGAGAPEAVIKVEVAESGIEVVPPEQGDHPPAEPDAFRMAGRASERARGLGDLVNLLLVVLLRAVRRRLGSLGRLAAALCKCRRGGQHECSR